MLSATFIDRPRLSLVISIVITLAGLIALTALPIAQFPDIVPPQVQVTARYPGAGATVVEQTVAQPIESQVVGVDQALYMKSTSGNDGSYTLTVSFAVGTNPDINTVNVQNRVSLALPQLPEEVSRQGVTVKKKSSAILQVLAIYSPDSRYDTLFLSNYATINVLDNIKRVPGVGDAYLFGALDYSMRVWLNTDRLTALGLTPTDVANALQRPERPGGRRPDRRAADRRRPVPAQHPDQGPADRARGVRERRRPRQPGRLLSSACATSAGSSWPRGPATRSAASTAARVP